MVDASAAGELTTSCPIDTPPDELGRGYSCSVDVLGVELTLGDDKPA